MKKFKKKIYASLLLVGMTGVLTTGTFFAAEKFNVNYSSENNSKDFSRVSTKLNADTENSPSYLLPLNKLQNTNNLNSPIQNIAFDNSGSTYALLTSNSTTYKANTATVGTSMTDKFNRISYYKMSDGSRIWNHTDNALTTNVYAEEYLAVTYVPSYLNRDAFFVSVAKGSDSNYYTVLIKVSDGSKVQATKLSTAFSSDTKFYIGVNSVSSFNVTVYGIEATTTTNNGSITNSIKLTTANFSSTDSNVNNWTNSGEKTVSLDSGLINNYFVDTNKENASLTSKVIQYYTDNNFVYFVFQQNSLNGNNAINNYVTIMRVPTGGNSITLNSNSLYSVNLSSNQIATMKTSSNSNNLTARIAKNSSKTTLIISGSNTSTYLYGDISENSFNASTPTNLLTISSTANAYIVSISNLYNNASNISNGDFIALLSNNTAVRIRSDFSAITLLYNFNSLPANTTDSKLIFNLFTRPNDASWYAQMTDGSIIQFSGTNLVGQLGTDSINNRTEFVASSSLLSESEIQSNILFQKVSDDGNNASESFKTFIKTNASKFFNVSSYDSVFGQPIFDAEVGSISKVGNSNNYAVSINFYQNLRKITNGVIDSTSPTKVWLSSNNYTFTNENCSIVVAPRNEVTAEITSLLPSQVTQEELSKILTIQNAGNYLMYLEPNDAAGVLTVKIKSDAVWIENKLLLNYTQSIDIGSSTSPYFNVDVLNGLDSSVNLVTDEYLNNNSLLKTSLTNKYSGTLPSEITANDIINDFLIFGEAFSNRQLLTNGLIEKPLASNVQIYPIDSEGYLYVTVVIPKIGNKTNVRYSFVTAQVFKKDFTTNQNVFLNFINNQTVLNSTYTVGSGQAATTYNLSTLTPSSILSLINNDKSALFLFMDMSNYIFNIIAGLDENNKNVVTLTINPNDSLGTLTIGIKFNEEIKGLLQSYSCEFSGFTTSNTNQSGAPTDMPKFSWGTIDVNAFNGRKPSQITPSYLETNFPNLFAFQNSAQQLSHKIDVIPMSSSGAIQVTITFYDWWEQQEFQGTTQTVKIPEKSFSTVLTNGLDGRIQSSIDSIIWKSFYELTTSNAALTSSTASNALSLIESSAQTDLEKLQLLSNLSNSLSIGLAEEIQQNPDALSLSIGANDSQGTLSMYARITMNGSTYNYSSILSGFALQNADYSVSLALDASEAALAVKNTIPSNLTDEQIASLINISLGNDLEKEVLTTYDDIQGTLKITVNLYKNGVVVASTERSYTGFATAPIRYDGTNILIVIVAIIVPLILLLTPILYIVLFKTRKDIKKLSKVLDVRLSEESKKKKYVEVNKVEDLLKLDSDRF
ncbi:MAG: hypothetical protein K2K18_02100 [Malacoplasma sp.]|nr:hypothetical protein [Malacoplasma sp.]